MLNFKLCSEILKLCPLPCIYGQAIKNEEGIFTDFIIEDFNDKLCKLVDLDEENIKEKSINDIIPSILDKNLKEGKIDEDSYISYLDGWYKVEISYVKDDKYVLWLVENKEIQHLRTVQLLIDTIPDYIFYKDIDGNIVGCNKSYATELVELDRNDIIGKSYKDLPVISQNFESYRDNDLEVVDTRSTKMYYENVILKNGKKIYLEIIKTPIISDGGEVIGIIGIARDITERKEHEEALERARSEALANTAHELRTPLNLIFSSVQMLNYRYDIINNKTNDRDDKYLNIIKQNGYRLLKLVDNLIDSTKLTYEDVEFNPKNYDIVNFVESICDSVSDFANQNEMDIIFDTDVEEKVIGFDLDKMERIVLNLLSNAFKFNRKGKAIQVTIKDLKDKIQLSVKDEGIGIPKKDLYKVFDRFKQVKHESIDTKVGSGIGLSLVKSLVELHGGNIDVESELGQGSEFIIDMPCNLYSHKLELIDDCNLKANFVQKIEVEFSDIYA